MSNVQFFNSKLIFAFLIVSIISFNFATCNYEKFIIEKLFGEKWFSVWINPPNVTDVNIHSLEVISLKEYPPNEWSHFDIKDYGFIGLMKITIGNVYLEEHQLSALVVYNPLEPAKFRVTRLSDPVAITFPKKTIWYIGDTDYETYVCVRVFDSSSSDGSLQWLFTATFVPNEAAPFISDDIFC